MTQRILVTTSSFDVQTSESLRRLQALGFEIVCNPHGRRLTEAEVGALFGPEVVGMIAGVEPLTRAALACAPNLRVISRCGTGLDSVDLVAAAERGIAVRNTPDAPSRAVAELTLGLMLNLLRRISLADREVRAGVWKPQMGNLLSEQVVGIIGYGNIGRRVARLATAFGASVIAHDRFGIRDGVDVTEVGFEELLVRADIVTLHLPYLPENHRLLDAARLGTMKRGALLINAARGGLVDENALHAALTKGQLAGAALDCFDQEPYQGPLAQLGNVVMTAHMGSYAKEARALMEQEAAANLLGALTAQGVISA